MSTNGRPPTPHSGPYRSTNPDKDETEIDREAALAYARLRRRERPEDICADLGISRATFYRRIEMLMLRHDRPTRVVRQLLAEEELDELARIAHNLLAKAEAGDITPADSAKLLAEARQINASRRRLYAVDDASEDAPASVPLLPEHLRAAAQRADDELTRREAEIRARTEGA